MNLRTVVFGLTVVLALAILAVACGDDDGATEYDVSVQFNASATQGRSV